MFAGKLFVLKVFLNISFDLPLTFLLLLGIHKSIIKRLSNKMQNVNLMILTIMMKIFIVNTEECISVEFNFRCIIIEVYTNLKAYL